MNKQTKVSEQEKLTILYQRLSRDDPTDTGESNSIVNQRNMLEKYARDNGLVNTYSIADDGWSGTGWARPGWTEVIELIEAGKVANLLVKNLDRMGRDHLRVGLYMEQFQEMGVRFIAVNDGIDSARGEDDFTPFRAILAEFYAKDCSRKVKAVFAAKGNSGQPLTTQPLYGFLVDPNDKTKRIHDLETAPIVKRIFQMTIEGIGPFQIAHIFCDEKIERPSYYFVRAGILPDSKRCDHDRRYNWDGTTIIHIIKRREYKGDMVNFKTTKDSYKSKRYSFNPPEKWLVVEDYYPPIVDKEVSASIIRAI
ncbi:MAG: recombinase family protein [Lachnospiraceae bacterium]|jgi:DNA invertase Pin-like site-specific DNA recombinase|nr:recombinase family protein [Lachnospiraceae bacterium]